MGRAKTITRCGRQAAFQTDKTIGGGYPPTHATNLAIGLFTASCIKIGGVCCQKNHILFRTKKVGGLIGFRQIGKAMLEPFVLKQPGGYSTRNNRSRCHEFPCHKYWLVFVTGLGSVFVSLCIPLQSADGLARFISPIATNR